VFGVPCSEPPLTLVTPMIMFSTRDLTVRRQATCLRAPCQMVKTTLDCLAVLTWEGSAGRGCGIWDQAWVLGQATPTASAWADEETSGVMELVMSKQSWTSSDESFAPAPLNATPPIPSTLSAIPRPTHPPTTFPHPIHTPLGFILIPAMLAGLFPAIPRRRNLAHPSSNPAVSPTHNLHVHLNVTNVLGERAAGAGDGDGPGLEGDDDALGDDERLDRGDVLHLDLKRDSIDARRGPGGNASE
jgi:hypothetical protein